MIQAILKEALPQLSQEQLDRFDGYYRFLTDRNKAMNLTAITEPDEVAQKHFLDSLLPERFSLIPKGAHCIDVGTGAGLPGIPLMIMRPDITMVLLDSLNKRVVFLREALELLGMDAECIHGRAEDAARQPELRGRFDVALSRAVAPVNVLTELTLPFLRIGGVSLAYKGPAAREEIAAAQRALNLLHARASVSETQLEWGARSIVCIKKMAETPAAYPRKAGTPAKNPL